MCIILSMLSIKSELIFFVKYFAHLIQKPHVKTKMVPLIKGTQGCGKNSAFDIFHRFVIGPQSSLVCPSMERITARFNSIRQSKLSIVLDEAFDSNNRSMNNQVKSYITDDHTQIERKGLETIEVNDYANYVILTNNDFGSIIEANDRRYMCLVASECRVGDEKYFDHYFDTLANIDAGRDIFHYLARVDLTGFKPQSFPLTKYKKELKAKQTNNVVKWLLNMHETLSDEADDEIKIASTSDWYNKYCKWAETSGESRIMSLNVFSGLLKNEGIDTEEKNVADCGKRRKFRYRTISRQILEAQLAQYIE
ncbi:putative P-loop containing nucleoside triphosphate hydrolase [Plasmopara halstedii]